MGEWQTVNEVIVRLFEHKQSVLLLLLLKHHLYKNMKESQSVTNSLLLEVDFLSNRLKNIKKSFKTTNNKALKERLFTENKNIF